VVFLLLLLTLSVSLRGVLDAPAVMMMSLVMATLCPDLKDEIKLTLLPLYQAQTQAIIMNWLLKMRSILLQRVAK
jgi:hypothetical protein